MECVHLRCKPDWNGAAIVGKVPEFELYFVSFIRIHGQQLDDNG